MESQFLFTADVYCLCNQCSS